MVKTNDDFIGYGEHPAGPTMLVKRIEQIRRSQPGIFLHFWTDAGIPMSTILRLAKTFRKRIEKLDGIWGRFESFERYPSGAEIVNLASQVGQLQRQLTRLWHEVSCLCRTIDVRADDLAERAQAIASRLRMLAADNETGLATRSE